MSDLTNVELQMADASLKETEQIVPQKLLSLKEQLSMDVFTSMNEYIKVASTVDAPILDETNVLYKVDGIEVDDLFATLQLHSKADRRTDSHKEQDNTWMDKKDTESFATQTSEVWYMQETWIQTKHWNYISESHDTTTDNEENLEDIIWASQLKSMKVNKKLQELQKHIMYNLENLRTDYHRWKDEKSIALGQRYMQCEREMKSVFNKIKWIERLKQKLEDSLNLLYFKRTIKPAMDRLLERFVDWQQKQIKMWHEPEMSREEAITQLQPQFKKYLSLYN